MIDFLGVAPTGVTPFFVSNLTGGNSMGVPVPFYAKSLNVGNFYQVLSGDGPPTGAVVDALPIHALYIDTTNKKKYSKIAEGAGSEKWDQHVTLKDVSASMAGPNWRDPVQVVDQTS
jgi:hypothetical protein